MGFATRKEIGQRSSCYLRTTTESGDIIKHARLECDSEVTLRLTKSSRSLPVSQRLNYPDAFCFLSTRATRLKVWETWRTLLFCMVSRRISPIRDEITYTIARLWDFPRSNNHSRVIFSLMTGIVGNESLWTNGAILLFNDRLSLLVRGRR